MKAVNLEENSRNNNGVLNDYEPIEPEIINLKALLEQKNIEIPPYQRPYKWSIKNVNQLIDDVLTFSDKPAYRLGTIVYHEENNKLHIVDGQQRTITIILLFLAIQNNSQLLEQLKASNIQIPALSHLANLSFSNVLSKENIRNNYQEIERRVVEFSATHVEFLLYHCQLVKVVLKDISEAFQFFDAQNARGKDLEPHDLLKAFHLREMVTTTTEKERIQTVETWENFETQKLKILFSNYLFRIRHWAKGKAARRFLKDDVSEFKGVSPSVNEQYPYATPYRITHFYVQNYNQSFDRKIDQQNMPYPFQLDQVIINGKRFFEMIEHYAKVKKTIQYAVKEKSVAKTILDTLDSYKGRGRKGDQYVRNLFDCALMYYVDKFGHADIERAVEKIFIWAYTLRLKQQAVKLASMDNYAIGFPYIFKHIREALSSADFLNIHIRGIAQKEIYESQKTEEIKKIFETQKYIYE